MIEVDRRGLKLIPASTWYWTGSHDPDTWRARVTLYGPTTESTRVLPAAALVYVFWGHTSSRPYIGSGPTSWAATTAKLQAEIEKSLADEAGGPIAQMIAIPQDGGDGGDDDPLKQLKTDIKNARGGGVLVETTQAGWGEGRSQAPQKDWSANRLGPHPPASLVQLSKDSFARMLAACGASPSLFDDSDGTSKREALRQWHLGTVQPLARMLEVELSAKLEADVRLVFDLYNVDLAGRAQAFQKLVAGGVSVNEALATSGLLADG